MVAAESSFNNVYSVCGFAGGLLFALALGPQVVHTLRSRSAEDISLYWQGLYLVGLGSWITYSVYNSLWPVAGPQFMEFTLMALLTILKIVFDTWPKAKSASSDDDIDGSGKDKKLLKIPREVSAMSRSTESLIIDTASTTVDTDASALSLPGLEGLPSSNDVSPEKGGSDGESEGTGHSVVELTDGGEIEGVTGRDGGERRVLHLPDDE